ncbi:unnamed protein product [Ceutorhynchus assimilis]|uniref:Triokinase/FMN cyclase n=1 Tax=Ceutorhynchus assimilis TaxID=467358 RepID=A0A9N9N2L0_9CUCU|nr:unnamed protein product [Ceutorhynchus assimilis]
MYKRRHPDHSVDASIRGYAAFNQHVSLFEFGEVIVDKNFKNTDQVRLVSGGTSSFIEYVGAGMLTASIQGKPNDYPTPSMILRVLRELSVNHVKGVLVIVPTSSSNLLNFGLAIERADNDDLRVALLTVSDDCKNHEKARFEHRGLTGVVLVNKIAGALIIADKTITEIYNYCNNAINNILSAGVSFQKSLPHTRECLYCTKCETDDIGSGQTCIEDVLKSTFINLLEQLTTSQRFSLQGGDNIVVLVNNIGAFDRTKQFIIVKYCTDYFKRFDVKIARFYIGSYLQLDNDMDLMVTLLKVFDGQVLELLDKPCNTTGWKSNFQVEPLNTDNNLMLGRLRKKCRLSPPIKGPKLTEKAANIMQLCLQFACDALISCEKMLNKMDSENIKGGDGDTGTRLRIMANILNKRSCDKKLNFTYPFTFFLSLSKILENSVGGTMGCLYSIMFEATANTFGGYPDDEQVDSEMWIQAMENACSAVRRYGNVELGDRTLYDPLEACSSYLRQNIGKSFIILFENGVGKAEEAATASKQPGCKYPNAGAHAVGIWLRAVCEAAKLRLYHDSIY